jgi:hypothetical protein
VGEGKPVVEEWSQASHRLAPHDNFDDINAHEKCVAPRNVLHITHNRIPDIDNHARREAEGEAWQEGENQRMSMRNLCLEYLRIHRERQSKKERERESERESKKERESKRERIREREQERERERIRERESKKESERESEREREQQRDLVPFVF